MYLNLNVTTIGIHTDESLSVAPSFPRGQEQLSCASTGALCGAFSSSRMQISEALSLEDKYNLLSKIN